MSTSDGLGHRWGRNGEFCVTIGPVTRTAGILAKSVKGSGRYRHGSYASLIGLTLVGLKAYERGWAPSQVATDLSCLCEIFCVSPFIVYPLSLIFSAFSIGLLSSSSLFSYLYSSLTIFHNFESFALVCTVWKRLKLSLSGYAVSSTAIVVFNQRAKFPSSGASNRSWLLEICKRNNGDILNVTIQRHSMAISYLRKQIGG